MANQCFSKLTHNMFAHWPLFNWTPVSRGKEQNSNVREDGFVVLRWCGLRHRDKGRETGFAFVLMNFLWSWARKGIFFLFLGNTLLLHLSHTLCQILKFILDSCGYSSVRVYPVPFVIHCVSRRKQKFKCNPICRLENRLLFFCLFLCCNESCLASGIAINLYH